MWGLLFLCAEHEVSYIYLRNAAVWGIVGDIRLEDRLRHGEGKAAGDRNPAAIGWPGRRRKRRKRCWGMSKQEFLEELRRMLNRELDASEVADNIRYYSDYIDEAVRGGKSEAQVLDELGDPRMIARTILEVDQKREETQEYFRQEDSSVFTEDEDGAYREESAPNTGRFRTHRFEVRASSWKAWLIVILVIIVLVFLLGTVFTILWKLLPILLAGAVVIWIYHFITGR
jgi:hypothetical protein